MTKLKGAVRPFIAIIFTLGMTAGFFLGKVEAVAYGTLAGVAITYWFKSRDEEKAKP